MIYISISFQLLFTLQMYQEHQVCWKNHVHELKNRVRASEKMVCPLRVPFATFLAAAVHDYFAKKHLGLIFFSLPQRGKISWPRNKKKFFEGEKSPEMVSGS